ncbi:uncharacterized protein LOC131630503 [Vicia villosa]|uniref:uncharacterized protein LOC131630503 n=1 Tax=Vicia villosa TaxID=3911 RepID=UPI00273C2806|nr:uncharacterized protein LOC131630503 [Vicia villosa]
MKTKYFIFVFFLCALNLIFIMAMEPLKDVDVIEDFKTRIEVNENEYWGKGGNHGDKGREYGDGYWGSWTEGGWAGGLPEKRKSNKPGGESKGENKEHSREEKGEPIGRDGGGEKKEAHP